MSELTEAFDEWRAATRDLEAMTPGTPPWLRAHRVQGQRWRAYLALAEAVERGVLADPEEPARLDQAPAVTG